MSETLGVGVAGSPFDAGAPYAIEDLARTLLRLTRSGTRFLEAMPTPDFFTPQGDRWSPAEHVRHLTKSSAPLVLAYRLPPGVLRVFFGTPRAASRTFEAMRRDYLATLDAGGKAGRFTPSPEAAPIDPARRRAEILQHWTAKNDSLVKAWGRWRSLELDHARLPHPLLGKLTAREMAIFTVYHTSHHLSLVANRTQSGAR
jgi:hypothetical protein